MKPRSVGDAVAVGVIRGLVRAGLLLAALMVTMSVGWLTWDDPTPPGAFPIEVVDGH